MCVMCVEGWLWLIPHISILIGWLEWEAYGAIVVVVGLVVLVVGAVVVEVVAAL